MKNWRLALSDFLILGGSLLLVGAAMFWARSAMAAQEMASGYQLISNITQELPLPTLTPTPSPTLQSQPSITTALLSPTPTPTPPVATFNTHVVRLVIPRIRVDRAVVPIGLRKDASGRLDWNTDKLFATNNRLDLVGQIAVSVNPGDGGNVVLMGHNYNNGGAAWNGVFVELKSLQAGDEIVVFTKDGGEYHYKVQLVKKVPWRDQNGKELEKHQKFIWPTENEQLTLVTCGGANIWPWPARIYVVALPVMKP